MNSTLTEYLQSRDYGLITQQCVEWIRGWFSQNGPNSPAVIGISGGKDSSVVAALCKEALGRERVFGVMMPDHTQPDINVSKQLIQFLDIPHVEINVGPAVSAVKASVAESGLAATSQMTVNIPPRVRMTTLYAVSQCMNGRVSNNGNRSEKYTGYSTLFGDSAGDFSPLANLTATEVIAVGKCLSLPDMFVHKPPSDGLTGKTDEDNFGFTYEQLDTYILTGYCEDPEIQKRIDARHSANLFKLKPMPEFVF